MTCVIAFVLSWGMNAYAQDKVFFAPDPETARWSYLEMDGNGVTTATMVYYVDSMTGDAVNGSAKVKFESAGKQSSDDHGKLHILQIQGRRVHDRHECFL